MNDRDRPSISASNLVDSEPQEYDAFDQNEYDNGVSADELDDFDDDIEVYDNDYCVTFAWTWTTRV